MTDTSSHLPVCVYCGTARPADETNCPSCGRPWIDVTIDEAAGAPPAAAAAGAGAGAGAAAAATAIPPAEPDAGEPTADLPAVPPPPPPASPDDTGEFGFDDWTMPPDRPRSKARWIIPILLLVAVVVVWGLVFLDRGPTTTTTVALETTTSIATTTTAAATTTTAQDTTTTEATTTTTTVPYAPPSAWDPVGDPIPSEDLPLRAEGIGPLDVGMSVEEVAGVLTASFGEASEAGVEGVCDPEEAYWLRWDDLQVRFSGWESDDTFVSFRYGDGEVDGDLGLATLSGLTIGDTVADLNSTYSQYTITFEVIDGIDHFRLIDGGELLLWGPVSSTDDDGIVEGIYSPSACTA